MAQEPRLTGFEKALKDEGLLGTPLESVARSIYQQESSSGKNTKTSNAGARGPMQVLPSTFKAYNPKGNIDDPYDNSVGGLRYIKDLFSKTNDPGLTAVGYYGGPKAIEKAKAGIAVSDPRNPNAPNTLQYRDQVMGRTNPANAAGKTTAGQVEPKRRPPPLSPMIRQNVTELGPGYQAALALMAKTDDLEEARERIAQEEDDDTVADFGQAKQMLAQLQPITAFKDGGEVEKKPEPSLGEKVKGTAKEILRSTQYTPYDLLGAPVDIMNLGLKGVDYVTGSKLATEKPVGGSDYLIQKSRELGIADEPTGSTTETLTRMGTGILSPTAGPRAMIAAGKAVKGTAKAALEDLSMASTGQGGSKVAQQIMAPGTSFATEPAAGRTARSILDEIDPAVRKLIEEPKAQARFQGPELPKRTLTTPSKDRPFVSPLDKFFEKGDKPVTVEQLTNQLAKSSREYEMNRVVQLLADKSPTDKIRPSDLLKQLEETSPSRFRVEIKEPDPKNMGQFHASMENPFPSLPMGTVNLLEDVTPQEKLASTFMRDLRTNKALDYKASYSTDERAGKAAFDLELFFKSPMAKEAAGQDLAAQFKIDAPKIRELNKKVYNIREDMQAISYPYSGSRRFGFDYFGEQNRLLKQALDTYPDLKATNNGGETLSSVVDPILKNKAEDAVLTGLDTKYGTNLLGYKESLGSDWNQLSSYEKAKITERLMGDVVGSEYTKAQVTLKELERPYEEVMRVAQANTTPYVGQHGSIADKKPISFSRFQDVTLPTKENVMVIPELQSDRYDDLLKSGAKGGNQYKDADELAQLEQDLDSVTRKLYKAGDAKDVSLRDQLKLQSTKIEQRMANLRERLAAGEYTTPEFTPGIERMPQVMQQIMVKNAVYAGIQRGKNGVLFPGSDSAQAQLYEKLPNNLRAVIKDLGPGFEIRKVPLTYEGGYPQGKTVDRYGIFWKDDAAKRISTEGVRFKKGGMVDKNDADNQKYI